MTNLFVLRFTNVICGRDGETFPTLEAAIARGKETFFEFSIWHGDSRVASWTVFGGLRTFS